MQRLLTINSYIDVLPLEIIHIYIYHAYNIILYSLTIIPAQKLQTANAITSLIRMVTVSVRRKVEVNIFAM